MTQLLGLTAERRRYQYRSHSGTPLDRRLGDHNLERSSGPFANDVDLDGVPDRNICGPTRELAGILDGLSVEADHYVAATDAGAMRGAAAIDVRDQRSFLARQPEGARKLGSHVLHGDTEPATHHSSIRSKLVDDSHRQVDGDREPDSDRPAGSA